MNTKNLLLLLCLLGLSSLAFADLDITLEQIDSDGSIVTTDDSESSRLLASSYACTMILYSKENIASSGGLQAVLNIYGPPYTGTVADLDTTGASPSYYHDLYRIVYSGSHCDCTVTVYQGTSSSGKSKDYYSTTAVTSSSQTKIDIDTCWANKAASLSVVCTV